MIDLDKTDSIAICGDRGSGKTNLAFSLLNNYKGCRKRYLYGYPVRKEGFRHISSWTDLLRLTDSIIFVDEIHKYIKLYDRKANVELMELLSFLAQQGNTIIFTTQLSQFITKGVEASVQTWCVKQIDVLGLKNGCRIKRILGEVAHPRITSKGMALNKNEFVLWEANAQVGFVGVHEFLFQGVGKDWKHSGIVPTDSATNFSLKIAKETAE